jgi:hypothetical protein
MEIRLQGLHRSLLVILSTENYEVGIYHNRLTYCLPNCDAQ